MKKLLLILFILLAPVSLAHAESAWSPVQPFTPDSINSPVQNGNPFCSGGVCNYTPLEPLAPQQEKQPVNFSFYLQTVFRVLFVLGALTAVTVLTIGGITYMVSEIADKKAEAMRRIQAAVWGMLLLFASFLILYEINPNLLNFTLLNQVVTLVGAPANAPPSGLQTKSLTFGSNVVLNIGGRISAAFGIYDSAMRTALGCGGFSLCLLATSNYLSFNAGAANSPEVKAFQTKCENGSFTGGITGHVKFRPGDPFGDVGKTDMFCFLNLF